jgi:hypothetical protein
MYRRAGHPLSHLLRPVEPPVRERGEGPESRWRHSRGKRREREKRGVSSPLKIIHSANK